MTTQDDISVQGSLSNLIVTEDRSLGQALQHALTRIGRGTAGDKIVLAEQAVQAVQSRGSTQQRVLIALGSNPAYDLEIVRKIRQLCSDAIYVIGPREAGLILDSIRAGADDFIEDSDTFDDNLAEALSRQKGKGNSEEGMLICVASVRGGCGSSVISVNLTTALAQRAKRTLLCDFDLQGGVCDALLNLKPKHTIADLRRCLERLDRSSVEMAITKHASGVHLLSAPAGPLDGGISLSGLCQPVIRTVKQMFPYVVADLPRVGTDLDLDPLLSTCDKLVIVTQMDFNSIRSTRRALEQLDRTGVLASRIHIVANRFGQPNELPLVDGERALNRKIAHVLPDDSQSVNRSINCGVPYVIGAPASRIAKAVESIADALSSNGPLPSDSQTVKADTPANSTVVFSNLLHNLRDWMTNRNAGMEATT